MYLLCLILTARCILSLSICYVLHHFILEERISRLGAFDTECKAKAKTDAPQFKCYHNSVTHVDGLVFSAVSERVPPDVQRNVCTIG